MRRVTLLCLSCVNPNSRPKQPNMASTPHFELYKDRADEHRFRLRAANGENVLASTEGYSSKQGAQRGIDSVKTNAPIDSRYKRKANVAGAPYFLLVAGNGEELAKSETYSSTAAMENGVALIKRIAPTATVQDLTL